MDQDRDNLNLFFLSIQDQLQYSKILIMDHITKYCALDLKSNRLMNVLVFSTMVLLVFASIVIITIIAVTPIVMLAVGQLSSGQRDLIIEPRLDFLNASRITQIGGVTALPRTKVQMVLGQRTFVTGWFMNFKLERQHHLGTIGGDEPQDHNFVYVHESTGIKAGQKVNLTILNKSILNAIKHWTEQSQIQTVEKIAIGHEIDRLILSNFGLSGQFQVRSIFDTASGKFGIGKVNNFVYLDIRYAFQQIFNETYRQHQLNAESSPLIRLLNSPIFDLAHFSTEATVNFPDRVQVYSNPNYEETYNNLNKFGKELLQKVGLFSVDTSMPIAGNLANLGFVGMFVGVMFKLIICSLFLLSVLMMDNMLRMGVERKNFDFALLKVMGANRVYIIVNILAGSLKYVAVANLVAYPLAYLGLQIVTSVFQDFFGYRYQIIPTSDSVIGGLLIGVLVPIVSAIAPIWSVIRNDLAENLNPLRNKTQATKVQIYIQGHQFPTGKVIFGVVAAGYGMMIYYLLPRALINESLGLLLAIFFVIIQGLLIGLILLSFSIQYALEKVVAYVCLFWVESVDFILTLKNLSSHRFRNRRTSLLYTLSVSFIIFVSVGMQIQLQTMYIQLLKLNGSYIVVTGDIDRQFYNDMLKKVEGVEDWAYVSLYLRQVLEKRKGFTDVLISDKAKMFFVQNRIYAISPNLINTFFYEKVSVIKTEAASPYDPYSLLYSENGLMTCTISKDTASSFGILESDNHEFLVNIYLDQGIKRIPLKYTSVFQKRMGLLYSHIVLRPEIGVSFDTFRQIASIPKDEEIPIGQVKIKVSDVSKVKVIADEIRRLSNNRDNVWDYTQLKVTLDKIDGILTKVTYILLIIVLTISFFSLLTTTYINVINQTNEIAILLILGYEKTRIIRVYVYQSLIVVLNSCSIGLVVGYLVAQLMSLQREIFSELPINVEIRGVPVLLGMALLSSILSTYKPLKEIFSLTVSQILNYIK